ncbi:MAG: PhnD/SsuA/transferrin family substrate-binding protein [Sterolibacterium sp.]
MRSTSLWLCALAAICLAAPTISLSHADGLSHHVEPVRIGVLAFRPKPQTQAQWQPLARALKRAIAERDFIVEAYTYPELEAAVASRQVDFVLTNPGHYVLIGARSGLSAPLATLIVDAGNQPLSAFGGVIFSQVGRTDINSLGDIQGKTVATASHESFGGYQMQAFELARIGVRLHDRQLLITGMPHDNVVEAVLAGRAEIGFVRSGVLEGMAHEGRLELKRLKVLNQQDLPSFPQLLSTRLYPEWPFTALPHIDSRLARQVTAALFLLPDNDPAAVHAMDIRGFTIPADYKPVEDLLRELRLPPFDAAPSFTAYDVWERYRWLILASVFSVGLILLLAFRLLVGNRRLVVERRLVRQQTQRLQESEARFRSLIQAIPDPIWLKDPQGVYLACNTTFERLYGASMEQIVGKRDEDFVSADQAAFFRAKDRAAVAAGGPQVNEEWLSFAGDGHRALMETTKLPLLIDAQLIGILGIAHDITERKQAEAVLREKSDALQRSNLDLEQFAYSVSHDMRSPLRSVMGHLQLLEKGIKDSLDADNRENLAYALESAKRMDAMIVSLLDYSRVGRKTGAKQWLESRAPLDEALGFLGPACEEAHAVVTVSGEWPKVFASRDELSRLFQNLIGNALKYREAEQPPRIEVVSGVTGDAGEQRWRVSVRDHGIGIDPQQIGRLFQFFSRLQSRARYEGTGMGLALCRRIVEHHAGCIWVESDGEGQGSTFIFEIPLQVPEVGEFTGARP